MSQVFPYRFKTEQEFIEQFGIDWKDYIQKDGLPNWSHDMNHLFGKPFPFIKNELHFNSEYPINSRWYDSFIDEDWKISWLMLTKTETRPNYNPKIKILREI